MSSAEEITQAKDASTGTKSADSSKLEVVKTPAADNLNTAKSNIKTFFCLFKDFLLKPLKTVEDHQEDLTKNKNIGIITGLVAFLSLLGTISYVIFNVVRHRETGLFLRSSKIVWDWGYPAKTGFNIPRSIFYGILATIVCAAIVSLIALIAAKILRSTKQTSYKKLFTLVIASSIPSLLGFITYNLFTPVSPVLSNFVVIIAALYSFFIYYELLNSELGFSKEKKIYFHLIIAATVVLITCLMVQSLLDSISSDLLRSLTM